MRSLDGMFAEVDSDLDSDEPRLVLADALQAAGDPQGDLIAVQCDPARLRCERTRLARGPGRKVPGEQVVERDWMADVFATGDVQRRSELRATEQRLLREHVTDNQLTHRGVDVLGELGALRKLELSTRGISEAALARLRERLPTTEILA